MIIRSNEEILKKLTELYRDLYDWKPIRREVTCNQSDIVVIKISSMYEPPRLSFAILKQLSDFFGSDNIADSRFSHSGCDSCDYGSDYGFELVIKS